MINSDPTLLPVADELQKTDVLHPATSMDVVMTINMLLRSGEIAKAEPGSVMELASSIDHPLERSEWLNAKEKILRSLGFGEDDQLEAVTDDDLGENIYTYGKRIAGVSEDSFVGPQYDIVVWERPVANQWVILASVQSDAREISITDVESGFYSPEAIAS